MGAEVAQNLHRYYADRALRHSEASLARWPRRGIIPESALCALCRCRHKAHWTKAKHRLDRDFSAKRFGDSGYAREELVAELGTAFLCAEIGITSEVREDHAAYLGHWLSVLKEDKRAIFSAAAHAQRAGDYLNGLQQQQEIAA